MTDQFHENAAEITTPDVKHKIAMSFHGSARLTRLLINFMTVPQGFQMAELARQQGVSIFLSNQLPDNFHADYSGGKARFQLKSDDTAHIASLAHELRHVWQESKGLLPTSFARGAYYESFPIRDPYSYFLSVRLREADAFAAETEYVRDYAVKTGDTRPAERVKYEFSEIYEAYSQELNESGGDRKQARQAAFKAFFIRRVADYDRESLATLEKKLTEYKEAAQQRPMKLREFLGKKSSFALTPATIRQFGEMSDGKNYFSGLPDEYLASKHCLGEVTPEIKQKLDALQAKYREFFGEIDRQRGKNNAPSAP